MISTVAVLSGLTLIIVGLIHLPPFPASPEALGEAKVMAAFSSVAAISSVPPSPKNIPNREDSASSSSPPSVPSAPSAIT